MSAPRRWIEDGGNATQLERDLLRAGMDGVEPPPSSKKEVWAALLAQLPAVGAVVAGTAAGVAAKGAAVKGAAVAGKAAAAAGKAAAGSGAGVAGAAAGAGVLKAALIGAGSALAVIATYTVAVPTPPDAPQPAPSSTVGAQIPAQPSAARAGSMSPRSDETPEPAISASASAAPDARGAQKPDAPQTLLREESRALREARDALRGGDASGALAQLEKMRARFPGGVLAQEREALAIEALHKSGRTGEAAARAAAFQKAYPGSPLAERVQSFAK